MQINRILKQIREQRHFQLEDVASFSNISFRSLSKFETGEKIPSYIQLEKLADAYGIPSYVFLSQAIPNLPEPIVDFRRESPGPASLSLSGMQKIWSAEGISQFANQLAVETSFQPAPWASQLKPDDLSQAKAADLRAFFDDWFSSREEKLAFVGGNEQSFFQGLRLFIELAGTIVNVNDAPATDMLGFYLEPSAGIPLIFINRSISSKKAQLFTLVHEIAHKLLSKQGVSNPFLISNEIERNCNKFAAEFIAPMPAFVKLVESIHPGGSDQIFDLVNAVSRRTLLSRHATAIRLLEANYINRRQLVVWEKASRVNPKSEKQEEAEEATTPMGVVHAKRLGELGYLPTNLARIAVERKYIDSIDVQSGMHLAESIQSKAFDLARRRIEVAMKP